MPKPASVEEIRVFSDALTVLAPPPSTLAMAKRSEPAERLPPFAPAPGARDGVWRATGRVRGQTMILSPGDPGQLHDWSLGSGLSAFWRIASRLMPLGKVMVSVIGPLVAVPPTFATLRRYSAW